MQAAVSSDGDFGRRLKRARQQAGLTQMELAHLLATRQYAISRAENGRKTREPLLSRIVDYVRHVESPSKAASEEVVYAVAQSPELKALIERIATEL
ncbi:MAG: helix-turn-helix transcriptional regulator [Pseudomonadota bacterium]